MSEKERKGRDTADQNSQRSTALHSRNKKSPAALCGRALVCGDSFVGINTLGRCCRARVGFATVRAVPVWADWPEAVAESVAAKLPGRGRMQPMCATAVETGGCLFDRGWNHLFSRGLRLQRYAVGIGVDNLAERFLQRVPPVERCEICSPCGSCRRCGVRPGCMVLVSVHFV